MTIKSKILSVRFSPADYSLVESAASDKKIEPSVLVRSLILTAIENKFFMPPNASPSPSLDKLSFDARRALLRWLDIAVYGQLSQGVPIDEIEKNMLFGACLAEGDAINQFQLELETQK